MAATSKVIRRIVTTTPIHRNYSSNRRLVVHQSTYDINETREWLSEFKGGSVDLQMNSDTGIAVMVLNNPQKKNAITGKMMVDLESCIQQLEDWRTGRGLILHGAERTFCSGGDLDFVRNIMTRNEGFFLSSFMHRNMSRLSSLPLISMALIEGNALGGGAEITTACDFRFMTDSAKIGFVQAKMGVLTGWSGGTRLTKLIGRKAALHLLCSARVLNSESAFNLDLVDEIIPKNTENDPLEFATNWLLKYIGNLSPHLVQCIKEMTHEADSVGTELSLLKERSLFSTLWGGEDQKKAIEKAFKHN